MSDRAAVLKSLFAKEKKAASTYGQVVAKKADGLWLVRDTVGREATVASDAPWKPGVDWVEMQNGRVVARARNRSKIKVYEV